MGRATFASGLMLCALVTGCGNSSPSGSSPMDSVDTSDVPVYSPGGEPEIAVNPTDADNLVEGENVYGISYSHDGGATWTHVDLPNIGDNTLAVLSDGTFLYTTINGTMYESRDGGETWSDVGNWAGAVAETAYSFNVAPYPVSNAVGDVIRDVACNTPDIADAGPGSTEVPPNGPGVQLIGCDRPWLVADASTGKAFLAFTAHQDASGGTGGFDAPWELAWLACLSPSAPPGFQCGRQYVSASGDGGRTWSTFKAIDSSDYPAAVTSQNAGALMASFGTLATAYVAMGANCSPCVVFETSTDDGANWKRHIVAPAQFASATRTVTVDFEPYGAADPSQPGRYAVMVFDGDQTHLLVYVTEDWGVTWQSAMLAEPGDGVARWNPWIAYGPSGALGVVWKTSYADESFDVWAAVAPSGDTHFGNPVRISSQRSPGPVAPGGDDAADVTLTRDTLYAAWGDQRGESAPIGWFGSNWNHVGRYRFRPEE